MSQKSLRAQRLYQNQKIAVKGQLKAQDAIRVEIREYSTKNGGVAKYKTFIFKCKGDNCTREIKAQYTQLKKHCGFCNSCRNKGRPFEAAYNELFKTNHLTGKKEVTITYEDFLEFTKIKHCHYCNENIPWEPYTKHQGKEVSGGRAYRLDRKDNEKGYSKSNCVVCCWTCNAAKGNRYTYEEFYEMTKCKRWKNPIVIKEEKKSPSISKNI